MTRWAIGGVAAVTVAAVALHFGKSRPGPDVVVSVPAAPEAAPPPAAPPAPLARVVDVTDIDPLLDPPPIPAAAGEPGGPVVTAVGYEEPAPAPAAVRDAPPIPPAATDDAVEVAPMPREARRFCPGFDDGDPGPGVFVRHRFPLSLGSLPMVPDRAAWYTGGPFGGAVQGRVPHFWADWVPFPADFARPDWPPSVGFGVYF